ncbi:hypothetical protein M422DRAFT_54563 [Sphaerobolus stellatus SS14]|uniref:Unplaced genomic scaffold SPHSTscaffold_228, whole genome shotgun sequence n=1 Tax=Sphaerobolus stellatus (strain SS14) TaxID=990650 RepID=A0A0C9UTQ7_SPHS4|nr:hypothetical protein M422DRAFT_54563 [Sphaerobolus stellatus SS14]
MQLCFRPLTLLYILLFILIQEINGVELKDHESKRSPEALFSRHAPSDAITFVESVHTDDHSGEWSRAHWQIPSRTSNPDTTVVLLNWSRLSNVLLQAAAYCSPLLQDIVERVYIWNNRPNLTLSYNEHFSQTGCRPGQLTIYNSPENLLFQARFLGCIRSGSRYCFLQDDDYITRPEILRNIHAWFNQASNNSKEDPVPIILQPPHDHLESTLLNITIAAPASSTRVETSFACLGHGTFLLHSQAESFMNMLEHLGLPWEEKTIADNYFTILSGTKPNIWFTHTIELSYTETPPFTFGKEGDERNWRHINRAMIYLHGLLQDTQNKPLLSPENTTQESLQTAPCISDACIISSNVTTLPSYVFDHSEPWTQDTRMQTVQATRISRLAEEGVKWYLSYPLMNAVDGDAMTAFRSFGHAKAGDTITLALYASRQISTSKQAEMAFLVDVHTAAILHSATFQTSMDHNAWNNLETTPLLCYPTTYIDVEPYTSPPSMLRSPLQQETKATFSPPQQFTPWDGNTSLMECSVSFELISRRIPDAIRLVLPRNLPYVWAIYETWLRLKHG